MDANPSKYYNIMDEAYVRKSEVSLHNAYYNLPAVKSLLQNIKGKRILEIGCACGILTEWLIAKDAYVIALDISEKMVEFTKKRFGQKAEIYLADVSQPLNFVESKSIDIIVASLVLHYIDNWLPVFSEFQRVLKKDGEIVISIHHPHADWKWFNKPNYFIKELYEDYWIIEGRKFEVKYYHRTLAEMFSVFKKYGFFVDVLLEPYPLLEGKKIDLKSYEKLLTNPHFLFLKLKKINSS